MCFCYSGLKKIKWTEKNIYHITVTDYTHVIALFCLWGYSFSYVDFRIPLKEKQVNKQFTKKSVLL